jgi:uncharacterized membrane protein
MKSTFKKDLILWIVIIIPAVYLASLWNILPEKVPVHWDIHGEVNRYGGKTELLFITLLPFLMYLLFMVIPKIDPKNKLKNMGSKYSGLRSVMIVFMSALAMVVIYTGKNETFPGNMMLILIGGLFTLLGNYFKTIKANYFIGIRTPWTLENETVWKETHLLGGKLWFAGGIAIILSVIFLPENISSVVFAIITAIIIIVPVVYSYLRFRKLKGAVE